ncbi:MAG: hypothetical protein ACRDCE_06475, partial [Cetobacterium sp.]|uniref:hypothetical protein n=1 Tax=Cetobacterium sp. TaxID=2071632 RepID=UPI003EE7E449
IQSGSGGGSSNFLDLMDTPPSFTGQAGMLLGVNAAEDGLEYIIDSAIPIMQDLEDGNLPIKWNNMKQKIAASSLNVTQTNIAENAFTIGLGGNSGRSFSLPDIVDADTSPLGLNQVREGRITFISQQGSSQRNVNLNSGCKFNIGGTTSDQNLIIHAGETWVLLPAIYGNGDKCWSLIGTFSANNQHPALYNGYTRIGGRSVSHNSYFSSSQINQSHIIHSNLVGNSGGTIRYCFLPEILPFSYDGWIETTQVRHGKEMTFTPIGSTNMILRPAAGQQWWVDGSISTGDRTITPGIIEKFIGIHMNGVQTWFMLSRTRTDGSSIEIDAHNTRLENLEARPTFDDEYKTKIDDLEARPQFTDEYKTKIDDLEARPQ